MVTLNAVSESLFRVEPLVCTDHDDVDYGLILEKANLIIDSRGVYRDKKVNVISA